MILIVSAPNANANGAIPLGELLGGPPKVVSRNSRPMSASVALRWEVDDPEPALRARVAEVCATHRLDHAFIPVARKLADFGLLAMDMDSTLITIECVDELADLAGRKAEVSRITEAAMRGEIKDYQESLRHRVALLEGLDEQLLARVFDERLHLSEGALELLAAARDAGLRTLLVSGGFTYFTSRLKQELALDYTHANTIEIREGRLTGRVVGPIVDGAEKARELARVCSALAIPTSEAIVVGDGANDLDMMALAGLSVAYHAKPIVAARATQAIRYGGLATILDWLA